MHLELREGLMKVGEDIKQRISGQMKSALTSIYDLTKLPQSLIGSGTANPNTFVGAETQQTENLANQESQANLESKDDSNQANSDSKTNEDQLTDDSKNPKNNLGRINNGKRIGNVLQEKPIESFNEYLFALAAHVCYQESEDTVMM